MSIQRLRVSRGLGRVLLPLALTILARTPGQGINGPGASGTAPLADARIPVTWSTARGCYLTPDFRKVTPNLAVHRVVTPYPNVVWNQARQSYQTLDGSPLPLVKGADGQRGIPAEAVDPYWGVSGRGKQLQAFLSPEGKQAGKIPVYYDPNRQGYFDAADRPITSWNDATHELVQPSPNVYWNQDKQAYATRDGSPLPWIEDARGWEGIPVEDIDPTLASGGSYQNGRQSADPGQGTLNLQHDLTLFNQADLLEQTLNQVQINGGKVPPEATLFLQQVKDGFKRQVLEDAGNLGRDLPQALDAVRKNTPSGQNQRKLHISQRGGYGSGRNSALDAGSARLSAGRQAPGTGALARDAQQMQALAQEGQQAIASGNISSAYANSFASRFIALSQQTLKDMNASVNAYASFQQDWNQWQRQVQMQESATRVLRAAQAGNAGAALNAVGQFLDLLPSSIGGPAKKYFQEVPVLYARKPVWQDPLTGTTDVDEAIYGATADLFADWLRQNPACREVIQWNINRITAENDMVLQWGKATRKIVDDWCERQDRLMVELTDGTIGDALHASLAGWGYVDPQTRLVYDANALTPQQRQQFRPLTTGQEWLQAMADARAARNQAVDAWNESHTLAQMVAARLSGAPSAVPPAPVGAGQQRRDFSQPQPRSLTTASTATPPAQGLSHASVPNAAPAEGNASLPPRTTEPNGAQTQAPQPQLPEGGHLQPNPASLETPPLPAADSKAGTSAPAAYTGPPLTTPASPGTAPMPGQESSPRQTGTWSPLADAAQLGIAAGQKVVDELVEEVVQGEAPDLVAAEKGVIADQAKQTLTESLLGWARRQPIFGGKSWNDLSPEDQAWHGALGDVAKHMLGVFRQDPKLAVEGGDGLVNRLANEIDRSTANPDEP